MAIDQKQNLTHIDNRTESDRVIVVGGGLAGLTAAALVARSGRSVMLFERSSHLGGRAESQDREGFIFNLGAHALYEKGAAVAVLNDLGVRYTTGSPKGIVCLAGGRTYLAPVDTTSMLKTGLLDLPAKWEATRLLLKLQTTNPANLAGITLNQWLDREVRRPEVRLFFEMGARVATYSDAPGVLSMGVVAEQLQLAAKGKVLYVDGGWQVLVDGLEKAARRAGARIVTGARVEAVEREPGRVTGVRLADGTFHAAGSVIVAAAPRDVVGLVEGPEVQSIRDFARNAVQAKAACLDVALKRLPRPENAVVMSPDRPLFLTTQSQFCRIAPDGQALVHNLKYLDPTRPQDAEANERELEGWLDETQPGWREQVVERRYLPGLVVSNVLPTASLGGIPGRPEARVQGIDNLYLAGDWVGPRGLLANAAISSARAAAEAVVGRGAAVRRAA